MRRGRSTARLFMRGASVALGFSLLACTAPPRTAFTSQDQAAAFVPGFPDVRFFADAPAAEIAALQHRFIPQSTAPGAEMVVLALSSGGEGGAFGAGLLTGWTKRGDRPAFDLVTGVSAGALIAPFAFAGVEYDDDLAQLFDDGAASRLNRGRSLIRGLLGQSVLDGKALRSLIDSYLTDDLVAQIAARHRTGARLLVVTTNLDAGRSVVWDIGAIAVSNRAGARGLIGDILQASASIPAIFPSVMMSVTDGVRDFAELHADGGAGRQVFFFPDAVMTSDGFARLLPAGTRIYTIMNRKMAPEFQVTTARSFPIAERGLSVLETADAAAIVSLTANLATDSGLVFRMAAIDITVPTANNLPFDPAYMRAVFSRGQAVGKLGDWMREHRLGGTYHND